MTPITVYYKLLQGMEKSHLPKNLSDELIDVIASITHLHSIYLMGVQKTKNTSSYLFDSKNPKSQLERHSILERYSLALVIITTKEFMGYKNFMNQVYTKMKGQVQIYPILYTVKDFKWRTDSDDSFLSRIISKETELYSIQSLSVSGYYRHPGAYERLSHEWKIQINRVEYIQDQVGSFSEFHDTSGEMLFHSQAVRQACIAFLAIYWDWRPSFYDLDYLLNLCSHFSKSPEILLSKESFRSHKIYNALCQAQYNLNFKSHNDLTEDFSVYARRRCRTFFKSIKSEGEKKIQELYKHHHRIED